MTTLLLALALGTIGAVVALREWRRGECLLWPVAVLLLLSGLGHLAALVWLVAEWLGRLT